MAIQQPAAERGVVVDEAGYFVAAWQWDAGTPAPKLPAKVSPKLILLREPAEALNPPSEKAKWDFVSKTWSLPTDRLWIVEEATGRVTGGGTYWLDRLKPLLPGRVYVDVEPPKARGRRPIWTGTEWVFPRRVALVTPAGEVANVCLENPNPNAPDVDMPPGWERFDDRQPWPTTWDGEPIGPGARRNPQGNWERPERPETPAPQGQ